MSEYYNQEFVSPEPLIAKIVEELKSYFSTGIVDQLLIPVYISNCLYRLGRATLKVDDVLLPITGYCTDLPLDFRYVRELWATTIIQESYTEPGSVYQQLTFKLGDHTPAPVYCDSCVGCTTPDVISAIYRTDNKVLLQTQKTVLLEPGNIISRGMCKDSPNLYSTSGNKFDLRGTKLTVEFEEGLLYLKYYAEQLTEEGYQLIPDDFIIQEYIEAEIKAKLFENISNAVTDETYNQVQQKMIYYRRVADEKLIDARTNMKKKTPKQHADTIRNNRVRFRNKYNL